MKIGSNILHSVHNVQQELNGQYALGVNLGLSIFNCRKPQSAETLIKEADGRMYAHKRNK